MGWGCRRQRRVLTILLAVQLGGHQRARGPWGGGTGAVWPVSSLRGRVHADQRWVEGEGRCAASPCGRIRDAPECVLLAIFTVQWWFSET